MWYESIQFWSMQLDNHCKVFNMKKLFFAFCFLSKICVAQPEAIHKISSQVSELNLKKNLYYLANDKLEGRLMASYGDSLAAVFVADWFGKNKLDFPYPGGNNYFGSITGYKINKTGSLKINGKSYAELDNWTDFAESTQSSFSIKDASVLLPSISDPDSICNALSKIDSKGKVIILPSLTTKKLDSDEKYLRFLVQLGSKGIVATIEYASWIKKRVENEKGFNFLPEYIDPGYKVIDSTSSVLGIGFTEDKMNELLAADQFTSKSVDEKIDKKTLSFLIELKTKISVAVKRSLQTIHARNVYGIIKGSDTKAGVIIISAHRDHDGRNGKIIYPGAVDNASGTVAIMEIAALMNKAKLSGIRPKRTIVFASFTGEERGKIGSYYYVSHPIFPLNKTYAVLNIDMLGRVDSFYSGKRKDSSYVYIVVSDSLNRGLRNAIYKANDSVNLHLDTYYEEPQHIERLLKHSDHYPFYRKGIPFIHIDCGFCKDYHMPTDTADKIDYELLKKQTRLAFLTLWNLANN